MPANVDEAPEKNETPRTLATRLARIKAEATLRKTEDDADYRGATVLAADTVVAVGRRALPKAELSDEAEYCLRLLSGRAHRVYTGICLMSSNGAVRQKLVETRVRFKRLSNDEVTDYIASGEWRGKAGGYAIQGLAGSFVVKLVGSYSNVVGLPLYETASLLAGSGYPMRSLWSDPLAMAES